MSKKIYRIGIMGYGQVAQNQMRVAIDSSDRVELGAVASLGNKEVKNFSGPVYDNYEDLLKDDSIDIMYISTPNTMHPHWTIKSLEAQKHVLCEKPLAMNKEDFLQVKEAALQSNKALMEGFMYRYMKRMDRLDEVLASGIIGDITYISSNFFSLRSRLTGIRSSKKLGGGSLWDLGVYPISLISHLFPNQKPTYVTALAKQEGEVDAYVAGEMGFSSKVIASFSCGWISDVRTIETRIIGTKGVIEVERLFNWEGGSLSIITDQGKTTEEFSKEDPFLLELHNYVDHLEQSEPLRITLDQSEHIIELMNMVEKAILFI
ncbi:MAG: Gfo/Idh/MocA family oxidoreductase [Sphaerochaetaceae bacterium]|jgi:xylose dehydrogenase (NAD/NADP)